MSYKIWGKNKGLLSKNEIIDFFRQRGVLDIIDILTHAEESKQPSVTIGRTKVMLFKF